MFSTPSENCIPICQIFHIIALFAAELEEPKIGMLRIILHDLFSLTDINRAIELLEALQKSKYHVWINEPGLHVTLSLSLSKLTLSQTSLGFNMSSLKVF